MRFSLLLFINEYWTKKNGKCNWITTSTDAHTLLAHVTSYTARTWKNTVGLWKFPSQCARASIRFLLRLSHTCISSIGVLYDTSSSTYPMCKLVSMLPNIYYLSSLHSVLQATRILCLKYTCARTEKQTSATYTLGRGGSKNTEVLHKRCFHTIHYSTIKFGSSIWQENLADNILVNAFVIPHSLYLGKNILVINLPNLFSHQIFVPYSTWSRNLNTL